MSVTFNVPQEAAQHLDDQDAMAELDWPEIDALGRAPARWQGDGSYLALWQLDWLHPAVELPPESSCELWIAGQRVATARTSEYSSHMQGGDSLSVRFTYNIVVEEP